MPTYLPTRAQQLIDALPSPADRERLTEEFIERVAICSCEPDLSEPLAESVAMSDLRREIADLARPKFSR